MSPNGKAVDLHCVMQNSDRQKRSEQLALDFRSSKRPALVIEFAGVPKAGKTSTLNQVYAFLRRCGFRCEVVVERASVCPIKDKKHFNFNVWTACTSLAQLLEKTQSPPRADDPDILFLDRGVFDSICWLSLLERLGRMRPEDESSITNFLLISDWTDRVSGVVAMSASPEDALTREHGHLPVEGPGGSIMNNTVLNQMGSIIKEKAMQLQDRFRVFEIDTSSELYSGDQKRTCEDVTDKVLDWVAESIEENILSVGRDAFSSLDDELVVGREKAAEMIEVFESKGNFEPRKKVEADLSRVQPLPVVVVRNHSGNVLTLVRKEKETTNNLHKKTTIWAGGHVRREDGPEGTGSILSGAIRELQEELRIYATPEQLTLLGSVYATDHGSTKKHLAFVYEWTAKTDDVEIALCNSEFMEKGGTSLQGVFLSPERIMEETENMERWSKEILTKLLVSKS